MSLRDAAREVVKKFGLTPYGKTPSIVARSIVALQRELAMTADRDALSTEIHARRQTDSVEKMQAFRLEWELLMARYVKLNGIGNSLYVMGERLDIYAALERHLFGDSK